MSSFYANRRWRKVRALQLSLFPLCAHCLKRGVIEPATEVDHVIPIDKGGEIYDLANLQSLDKSCHARKTRTEHGQKVNLGCDSDGLPIDPNHPWNKG